MTHDMMNLRTLVEKTPDADLLREMIGFAARSISRAAIAEIHEVLEPIGDVCPECLPED
jgi:hypothetical protein